VASVFAVVSKKVFESEARIGGKVIGLGAIWATSKYKSTQPALKPLASGGHLFLVTVRPPSEALWLIAVLRDVKGVKDGWEAKANTTPVIDITSLKSKIHFASGSGITAAKGKLGMSLQMPRELAAADIAVLLAAAGGAVPAAAPASSAPAAEKIYHLNAHEKGPLPCLCVKCLEKAGTRVVASGETFVRKEAHAKSRVLYYWLPESLANTEVNVRYAIEQRMKRRLADVIDHSLAKPKKRKARARDDDEDDDE
jgi:hypothetical protein